MRAVDTNVLVRLLVRDDGEQTAAAERFIQTGAVIPHIALVETVWVLDSYYERGRADIARVIDALLDHETLVIQDADVVREALDTFRANKAVDFADCLILAVTRRSGHSPLGTFDIKFAKIDGVERLS